MTRQDGPGQWRIEWDGKWQSGCQGSQTITTVAELAAVLATRDADGDAQFLLGKPEAPYPYLALLVSHDRWYVYYFPNDAEAGSFVAGDSPNAVGTTRLPAGWDIEVDNTTLVSGDTALRAASEFMTTGSRPTGLRWVDL